MGLHSPSRTSRCNLELTEIPNARFKGVHHHTQQGLGKPEEPSCFVIIVSLVLKPTKTRSAYLTGFSVPCQNSARASFSGASGQNVSTSAGFHWDNRNEVITLR